MGSMRDKQQTASTVASPSAYVYGRRVLGVRSEVQATTSLFCHDPCHAMPYCAMSTAVLEGGVIPDGVPRAQKKKKKQKKMRRSKNKRHRHITTFLQAETTRSSESYYFAVTGKRKKEQDGRVAVRRWWPFKGPDEQDGASAPRGDGRL